MKLRQPSAARRHHLQWTHHGTVTATYFVDPLDYGLRPPEEKELVASVHESLALNCPDDTLLLSVLAPLDLADVMHRSLVRVDLERTPDYIRETLAGYRRIADIAPLTRIYTMTMPIGRHHLRGEPSPQEVADQLVRADEVLGMVDPEGNFGLTAIPEGLLAFLWNHNLMRGAALEMAPQNPADASPGATPVSTVFRPGILDEGARSEKSWRRSWDPMIKVMTRMDDGEVLNSYQAMLVPRAFPAAMAFPGHSEFLSILDGIPGVAADWAIRVRRRDREAAMALNEKCLGKLAMQLGERDSRVGFHVQEITRKIQTLAGHNDSLAEDENAAEIEFTTVIAVGAGTQTELARSVETLKSKFRRLGIRVDAPVGAQRRFWMMLNPGAATEDQVYADYNHIISSTDFAAMVPFTAARLLDDTGPVIGVNLLSGLFEPLHFNFLGKVLSDVSPAIAIAGELGAGKSYFSKTLISIIADLLGQFLVIDRSPAGEYVPLLESIPDSVLIDLDDPDFTLDPLRLFEPVMARRIALDTILPLINVSVVSSAGTLLSEVLRPDTRAAHRLRSLADVRDYLCAGAARGGGRDADDKHALVRAMDAVEAPALFNRDLPPMPLSAAATVVRTHTLSLPTVDELTVGHSYANLPWRKRLGHALYELVGLLAREQFLRPGRFGALIVDEAYHFTSSTVGQQICEEFVRDGRKNSAGLLLASHDPKADYSSAAHNLIPNRFAFRHRDKTLARNTLEWLGVDIERDAYLIDQLRTNTSPPKGLNETVAQNRRGECFIADGRGRIGRGKILGPARDDRFAAVSTTPDKASL